MSNKVFTNKTKFLGVFYLLIIVLIALLKPKPIDWSDSFSKDDKIPYGSEIVFNEIGDLIQSKVSPVFLPIYNILKENEFNAEKSNYIFVNNSFEPSALDLEYLFNYVDEGNSLFVSASEFSEAFLDSLSLSQDFFMYKNFNLAMNNQLDSFLVHLNHLEKKEVYYFKIPALAKSLEVDTLKFPTTTFGFFGDDETNDNFLKVEYGEGEIFIHGFPYAFTNYAMLHEKNVAYTASCLSMLEDRPTYWDEYYKFKKLATSKNPLGILLSSMPLKWAWLLLLGGALMFLYFNGKRKQRVIPIVKPLKNESLAFTNTVGTLYFLKGEHHNIIKKKINFFKEYIKTHYFIKELKVDQELMQRLAIKSGHSVDFIKELFEQIKISQSTEKPSGKVLVDLTKKLNEFYKRN